jgi:hypothetical protein
VLEGYSTTNIAKKVLQSGQSECADNKTEA